MADVLAYDFVLNAIWAGLLASVLCGVLGTFVVVKRLVSLSGGISHAAFGGLGFCHYLGVEPLFGAAGVAVLTAVALTSAGPARERSPDALIGVLWALGMAVGVVFLHLTPGYAPDLMAYLFGNILTVSRGAVVATAVLVVVVVTLLVTFFKEFVAVSFDEDFAAVQGVPVRAALTVLMVLIALSIVFLIQLVGIILVIALLTVPPLASRRLARSLSAMIVLSTVLSALVTLGGLALSYRFDLPSGPAIVLLGVALLGVVELVHWRRRRRSGRQSAAVDRA